MKNRYLYQLICVWNEIVINKKNNCFGKLYDLYKSYEDCDGVDFLSLRILYYDSTGMVSCISTVMEKYSNG